MSDGQVTAPLVPPPRRRQYLAHVSRSTRTLNQLTFQEYPFL